MENNLLSSFSDIKERFLSAIALSLFGGVCIFYGGVLFKALCGIAFICMCYEIFFNTHNGHYLIKVISAFICLLGVISLTYIRDNYGVACCLIMILISSLSDIGGYFIGKTFGGYRPLKKISPNKTISGFIGAFLVPNILLVAIYYLPELQISTIALQFMILSSILGDLYESYIKRIFNIKDFGSILPGHGGVFDRFDSLIFVSISYCFIRYVF